MGLFSVKSTSRRTKQCQSCVWFKAGTWANCPGLGVCEQYAVKMQTKGPTDSARHGVKIVYNHDLACSAYEKKST